MFTTHSVAYSSRFGDFVYTTTITEPIASPLVHAHGVTIYCIEGNFGEILIWWFGEFSKDRQIKNSPILINACVPIVLRIRSPNLNFANNNWEPIRQISCYMVANEGLRKQRLQQVGLISLENSKLVLEYPNLHTRNRINLTSYIKIFLVSIHSVLSLRPRSSIYDQIHLSSNISRSCPTKTPHPSLTFLMLYTLVRIPWPLSRRIVSFSANFRSLIEALECIRCIVAGSWCLDQPNTPYWTPKS